MFYRPEDGHGLPHNPFNALIVPRPIGWISTRGKDGVDNLAPYSFFNGVAYTPPQVMFSTTGDKPDRDGTKDSLANIRETGIFCVNMVEHAATDAMNKSSQTLPAGQSEFDHAGVERAACETIDCARVSGAPATLECRMTQIIRMDGDANYVCFGTVTGIHLRDDCLKDGMFDITTFVPLARLGYRDYALVPEAFTLARPDD
ncbi:flavin reductase family protein [Alisedimentitalea sp. MJ-SS2]|uniref:flavin reductase family protein n=1 Tax=Aliisedimentitalea sp. MJ-SS2 TaxID=3049795 RepID=UPI0029138D4C|nr:flavin reductase family protein [Alisedimentitalea sp. MJ-SS2]MDU8928749.1 flavin reductase family protein [Alisedimentitalea sp. MJ-SS2]